jgi:hypothetical protein
MGRSLLILLCVGIMHNVCAQSRTVFSVGNNNSSAFHRSVEKNVSDVLTEFNTAFVEKRALDFSNFSLSESAKQRIEALWSNTHFYCNEVALSENVIKQGDAFQVRNIPLFISDTEGNTGKEEGIIVFDENARIEDVYFGIEAQKYKSLLKQGTSLTDFKRRQIILDFLDNFRTAYNRKDLDMLDKTFSDNALIIVGKVISEKKNGPDMMNSLGSQRVELIQYNKQQYINNLKNIFLKNSFIDVSFDEIEIVKHGTRDEIYGVNLRQSWRSSSYKDEGYLFLMIDFEDETHPIVHVRAWQPTKDTPSESIIELGDFDIVK